MIELVPASPAHVGRIGSRMRAIDALECRAFNRSPKDGLRLGLKSSVFAVTAFVDGSPHAMMGVSPVNIMEDLGQPWMLGTDEVMRHGRELLTLGPAVIAAFHGYFAKLENLVSVENRQAIRLLKRWGFTVETDPVLVGGYEFVAFKKTRA